MRLPVRQIPVALKLILRLVPLSLFFAQISGAALSLEPAEEFFTNLAQRLFLQQSNEFNFGTNALPIVGVTQIPVAPTNLYSSALHRILQVTANTLDATRSDPHPLVFRPLFGPGPIPGVTYIIGYTNDNRVSTLPEWLAGNPGAVPLIIAARKGFPNFNELNVRSDVSVQRKVELRRSNTNSVPNHTNEMYLFGVSNLVAVEAWNSYESRFTNDVTLQVSNVLAMTIANTAGIIHTNTSSVLVTTNSSNDWFGRGFDSSGGFQFPLYSAVQTLPWSAYRFSSNTFDAGTSDFETVPGYPIPSLALTLSNHVSYLMAEGDAILDFVVLDGIHSIDITRELLSGNAYQGGFVSAALAGVWDTNRYRGLPSNPTIGLRNQIGISLGNVVTSDTDWNNFGFQQMNGRDKERAIDAFRAFFQLAPIYGTNVTNTALVMGAPFSPAAKLVSILVWEANDPLVHYHSADLFPTNNLQRIVPPSLAITNIRPSTIGRLNDRYSPWAGHPHKSSNPFPFDPSLKDPGVYSSDQWNFPRAESLRADWIGRVHRGTPWQTVYLKSGAAEPEIWSQEIGRDWRTHPTNDWKFAELIASLVNTNDPRTLLSINNTNVSAWAAALNGITVLSNTLAYPTLGAEPEFDLILVESNAPQIAVIVNGLGAARSQRRGEYFTGVAEILGTPELGTASPWLNLILSQDAHYALTDEAYEALPAQLLSRVRADPVAVAERSADGVLLRFRVFANRSYRLEFSSDLRMWNAFGEPHLAESELLTITIPPASTGEFFRLRLLP